MVVLLSITSLYASFMVWEELEYLLKKDFITAEEDLEMRMWGLKLGSFFVILSAQSTRLGSFIKSRVLRVLVDTGELWVDLLVLGEEFLVVLGLLGVVAGDSSARILGYWVSKIMVGRL